MSQTIKERIILILFALLSICFVWMNTTVSVNPVEGSMMEATNTAVYGYLPLIIKPAGTPTVTPTPTATPTNIPSPMDIQIDLIVYNPPGSDVEGEYVQLTNAGSGTQSMDGWTLHDVANNKYIFNNFSLGAGTSVKVWVKVGTDTATNLYSNKTWSIWNNDGDTATLKDQSNNIIDTCMYDGGGVQASCP